MTHIYIYIYIIIIKQFLAFQKKKEKKSKRNKTKSNVKESLSAVNSLILDTSDGSFVSDITDSSLPVDTESSVRTLCICT